MLTRRQTQRCAEISPRFENAGIGSARHDRRRDQRSNRGNLIQPGAHRGLRAGLGDFLLQRVDLRIEHLTMRGQYSHRFPGLLGKAGVSQRQVEQLLDAMNALGRDEAELGQMDRHASLATTTLVPSNRVLLWMWSL